MNKARKKYHQAIRELNSTDTNDPFFHRKFQAAKDAYQEWMKEDQTQSPPIWIARYWKPIGSLIIIAGMILTIITYNQIGGESEGMQGIGRPEWFVIFSCIFWVTLDLLYIRWARKNG